MSIVLSHPSAEHPHSLVVSPDGIEYHRAGLSIVSDWENAAEIRTAYHPTLILHHGAATHRNVLVGQTWNMSKQIPLDIFDYDPYSDLAQDLRTYAPHLFRHDTVGRAKPAIIDDDPWL